MLNALVLFPKPVHTDGIDVNDEHPLNMLPVSVTDSSPVHAATVEIAVFPNIPFVLLIAVKSVHDDGIDVNEEHDQNISDAF